MSRFLCLIRLLVLPGLLLLPAVSPADIVPPPPSVAPSNRASGPAPEETKATPAPVVPSAEPAVAVPAAPADGASASVPAGSPGLASNPDETFARALTAYQAGAMEEARLGFLAILESGKMSAPLAHNLGNIEFRRGNPGQAVLWYKRALAIQPFSPETLQNLRTIRRQTAFLSFDPWGLSVSYLKPVWIENGTILTAWAIALLILWLGFLTPRRGLRWPLVTLLILLLPVLAFGSVLIRQLRTDPQPLHQRQIVSNKETSAYAAPAEASSSVMTLPAGSEVVPLETRGNWLYCMIPGGDKDQPLRGWIRAAKLEPLWPWSAGI